MFAATPATHVAIASTFTADGVVEPLSFWLQRLGLTASIQLAPWGQLFQTLLDRSSAFFQSSGGINLALLRVGDLARLESDPASAARDLGEAMRAAAAAAPLIVYVAPSTDLAWVPRVEETLCTELRSVPGISVLSHSDVRREYPVDDVFDAYRERLGEIPYTELYFIAIATSVARRIRCLRTDPKKVVVVDCDDTLWGGLCSEAGPAGITLDDGRLALQRFLVEQHDAGMLVCICSRNNPDDVMRVFDRPEMVLRKEHITTWRVNWNPKSESITTMARELELGIESFVFLDDDAFVCGEVRVRCPGITVVQVPDSSELGHFVRHLWVFDRLRVTQDDRNRAQYYKQNAERERTRLSSTSLREFLAKLELVIRIAPLTDAQVPRVAQLTQRTNQFNATGVRRSESEIRSLAEDGFECHVIDVSDRFGTYGLAGVVIAHASATALDVDTFLLSCRVLGRGVEHHVVAELGRMAKSRGLGEVVLRFRKTTKNAPFDQFFRALPAQSFDDSDDVMARLDATRAAALTYDTDEREPPCDVQIAESVSAGTDRVGAVEYGDIARRYSSAPAILAELLATRAFNHPAPSTAPWTDPSTDASLDTSLLARTCWLLAETLGIPAAPDDSYLDLGGDSLLAIAVLSRIATQLGVELELRDLFEAPDLRDLAARIEAGLLARTGAELDCSAEHELAARVGALSDAEIASALATWSSVELAPAALGPSDLTGPRRNLLARLVAQHRIDAHVAQPLAHRAATTCDATFTQQRMWELQALGADFQLSMPRAYAIRGPLDVGALRAAVVALVARHPALRTGIAIDARRLVQTVRDHGAQLDVIDLATRDEGAERVLFDAFAAVPHDLTHQPLRVQLVKLGERDHLLFVAAHHIMVDGFSYRPLWIELPTLYRAALTGTVPDLPDLALAFGDFAFWQTTLEQRPVGRRALEFWANTIADYAALELPGDRVTTPRTPGPRIEAYPAADLPFALDGATWTALSALCSRLNVPPYSAIATMLFLFLTRTSGRDEACAMSASHHRTRPGAERVIGNFVTAYPLRIAFDRGATLEAAVAHADQTVLAHRAHHNVGPSTALAGWSEVTRYNLNYLIAPRDVAPSMLGDAKVELGWQPQPRHTIHDLALYLRQRDTGVHGKLVYNANRFSPVRAAEIVARLAWIARAIATEPTMRVGAVPAALP